MSLGGEGQYPLMSAAMESCYDKGVLIISAAGNRGVQGQYSTISFPASSFYSIAVGALFVNSSVFSTGTCQDKFFVTSFSGIGIDGIPAETDLIGPYVEISAPGAGIYSSINSTKKRLEPAYDYYSGTSMASPLAAGFAALLWSKMEGNGKSLTNIEVRLMIKTLAQQCDIVLHESTSAFTTSNYDVGSGYGFPLCEDTIFP
eukprot:CAMPEP_0170530724 /NCGR_PEP_ID=MMETSP0209-20121228/52414_1 /TAXON_ID=665100 ORGANISM="Litonotus pictus, Strain P1" /NCGR_SAMPLE_ID=MMETSP0209 /ASSEMBLY_ACC=CAM_ASM_000301 /LENGTH=201 /DNA_ID=CAMNT_0010824259 /DNA_START=1134 /DNA_END=1735 /DNA_ORIENTATION=+